jgi:hypothetical protein
MKKYTLLFTITLGLNTMILSQIPNYVPSNGLVGWWPFSGNANDFSGNGNNGTVNGATLTTDRFGQSNNAYSFDGINDFISFLSDFDYELFTINLWIKPNLITGITQVVFDSDHPSKVYGKIAFQYIQINSINYLQYRIGGESVDVNNEIENQQWLMATIVKNADSSFCFVNAKKIYGGLSANQVSVNGNNFASLGKSRINDRFVNGEIDDVGIWNRDLTQCEINDLYNAQLGSFGNSTISINPTLNMIGTNAILSVLTPIQNLQWQSNASNIGWVNLSENNNYQGVNNDTLVVSNIQLSNHNQSFRAFACGNTSNIATIQISDTCLNNITLYDTTYVTVTDTNVITVYDTLLTTVTDTLIINTTLGLPAPNNENTILIYPNPASDFITIDNGNYIAMSGYSIKIENNSGQQVFQSNINQQLFTIDLSTWSGDGLYFVHLIDGQGNTVTVRKIVLQ